MLGTSVTSISPFTKLLRDGNKEIDQQQLTIILSHNESVVCTALVMVLHSAM